MRRRERPVVVTGLREPLVLRHRRLIRRRLVLMVVWIAGWAATGFVYDRGWLAIAILVVTGPVLWAVVWLLADRHLGTLERARRRDRRGFEITPGAGTNPP